MRTNPTPERAERLAQPICCAGAILDFADRGNAEEVACWVPFDEVVAVGWRW
jgi:hypothetical protein